MITVMIGTLTRSDDANANLAGMPLVMTMMMETPVMAMMMMMMKTTVQQVW
jgi:hypothetical protein